MNTIQQTIVAALAGIPGVQGVYDVSPSGAATPYLVVRLVQVEAAERLQTLARRGVACRLEVVVASDQPGLKEAQAIAAVVRQRVTGAVPHPAGWQWLLRQWVQDEVGGMRGGQVAVTAQFRLWLREAV